MNKYWKMLANQAQKSGEIFIYEQIGEDYLSEAGISAKQFAEDLRALGDVTTLDIHINTHGGSAFEGLAIYNLLMAHPATKIVYVDGIAASIASVIAMCGRVIMPENAFMFIHNPHFFAAGDAELMRKTAEDLEKTGDSIVSVYKNKYKAKVSGQEEKEIKAIMQKSSLLSAKEANELGFCDEIIKAVKIAASYDYAKFVNKPKEELKAYILSQLATGDSSQINNDGSHLAVNMKSKIENNLNRKGANVDKCIHCGADHTIGTTCSCQTVSASAVKSRNAEINEIMAIAVKHDVMELAQSHILKGGNKEDFANIVLTEKYKAKPISNLSADIGMSNKEIKAYSLLNAIRGIWAAKESGRPFEGLEKEASEAVAKITGKRPNGFFIPEDILTFNPRAAMSTSDATKGGYIVGTQVLGGEMIELFRNKTLVSRLGARSLSGLVGNVAIPRVAGGATFYWLPETGPVTASDQAFSQLGLVPHRLVGDTAYSKELLMQSSISVESFVREDLMRVSAIAVDLAAINGTGVNGQPSGILNVSGIGAVTFGAAATWAKIVEFETAVAEANADIGALSYLTTPSVRGKWKTALKVAAVAGFLWDKGVGDLGEVNGYPAGSTKQVPSNKVIFGNFADMILASWAGMDVVVDPYSLKRSGQIEITVTQWVDVGIRHAGSFCASSDSGAQ